MENANPPAGEWRYYVSGQEVFIRNTTPFDRLAEGEFSVPPEGEIILTVTSPVGCRFREEVARSICDRLNLHLTDCSDARQPPQSP
jgi:hypothetical protein